MNRSASNRPPEPPAKRWMSRALLAVLAGGVLWLAWAGYSQPGLLLQLANLRYCG